MFYLPNTTLYANFIENFDELDNQLTLSKKFAKLRNLSLLKIKKLDDSTLSFLKFSCFAELITGQRILITSESYDLNCNLNLRNKKLTLTLDWFSNLLISPVSNTYEINFSNRFLIQPPFFTNLYQSTELIKPLVLVAKCM